MPTAHFANFGSVYFVRPAPTTANSQYQCTGTPGITPPNERLMRKTYPGVNGQAIKKLGAGANSGKITGFIDASSAVSLASAKTTLDALAKGQTAGTASFYDGAITVSNAIVSALAYGDFWGYAGRCCLNFELTWEATG